MATKQCSFTQFYAQQTVLVTGATGFIGVALLQRLMLDTPIARVYLLVRGGEG